MKNIDKKIKKVLKESIKKVLSERFVDNELDSKWTQIVDMLGCERVLNEVTNYFSEDELSRFMESIDKDYDLNLFDEDDYNNI